VTTEQPVEIRTDLVSLTLTEGVALSTSCLEEVGTLLCVTVFESHLVWLKGMYGKCVERKVGRESYSMEENLELF